MSGFALLSIDCLTGRVRRYASRLRYTRLSLVDECVIQDHAEDTLAALKQFRRGEIRFEVSDAA